MKFNFYLDKPDKDITPIMLSISHQGFRLRIATGISSSARLFDNKTQSIKKQANNSIKDNARLNLIKTTIDSIESRASLGGDKISKELLLKAIQEITNKEKIAHEPVPVPAPVKLTKHLQKYIDDAIAGRRLNKGKVIKFESTKSLTTLKKHLDAFNSKLTFEDMTKDFFIKFLRYLASKEICDNTVASMMKKFRTFLRYGLREGLHSNIEFIEQFKMQYNSSETLGFSLSMEELQRIEKCNIENSTLSQVRDLFLIQTFTGMRHSDLANLKPANFDFINDVIRIMPLKTSEKKITIPIHQKLKTVLLKYPDLLLPVISYKNYNELLKELGKLIDLNDEIMFTKHIGGKPIETTYKKREILSTHCARRTFITLSLIFGILPEMVMEISGHTDRASFQKYVRIANNEAVNKVKDVWNTV